MRICVKPLSEWTKNTAQRHLFATRAPGKFALIFAAAALFSHQSLAWGGTLSAQTSRPQTPTSFAGQKADQAQKNAAGSQPAPAAGTPAAALPNSLVTNWPANASPSDASVFWDGHGLRIEASNSSLQQILKDVSAKTGANLQGMGEDQRVFGTYGPGPAREVIGQLLEGSGYNVLIIGDRGQGAPRRIVLSARPAGGSQPAAPAYEPPQNDADTDQQPQDQQPEEPPPPQVNPTPVPARPVGDLMQQQLQIEMQRQLQQQQLQQQQQQPNPQN